MKKILILLLLLAGCAKTIQYSELHDNIQHLQVINGKLAYITADNTNCTYPIGCTGDYRIYYDDKIYAQHNKSIITLFELNNKPAYITDENGKTLYANGKTVNYQGIMGITSTNGRTIYAASKDYYCTRHTCTGSWFIVDNEELNINCSWIPYNEIVKGELAYACNNNEKLTIIHGNKTYGPYKAAYNIMNADGQLVWINSSLEGDKIMIEDKEMPTPYTKINDLKYDGKFSYIGTTNQSQYLVYGEQTYGPYNTIRAYKITAGKPAIAWTNENKHHITYDGTTTTYEAYTGFFDLNGTLAYNVKENGQYKLVYKDKKINDASYPVLLDGKLVYIQKVGYKRRVEREK